MNRAMSKNREVRQLLIAFGIVAAVLAPPFGAAVACGLMDDDDTPGWMQPVCDLIQN